MKRVPVIILTMALFIALSACSSKDEGDSVADAMKKAAANAKQQETEQKQDDRPVRDTEPEGTEKPDAAQDPDGGDLFRKMSVWSFHFTSGAGGWETFLNVEKDGTFSGQYYDGNLGEDGPGYSNGTYYECTFNGKFSVGEKISDYIYRINIDSITYRDEPGKEEIDDEIRYVYTLPYGLEGVDSGEHSLYVYLPGTPMEALPEGYMTWITPTHFSTYVGEDWDYVEDLPDDLPFCGLYNDADCGFFSSIEGDENGVYLANRVKLPGLEPTLKEMHEDGTYRYEDMDPEGMDLVINTCVKLDGLISIYSDQEGFVKECLKKIYGSESYHDLYIMDRGPSVYDDKPSICGNRAVYAFWTTGSNEDSRSCRGYFMPSDHYEGDVQFGYAYIVSSSEYSLYGGEATGFYLSSLKTTGREEEISSAGGKENAPKERKLVMAVGGGGSETLVADEVIWVTEEDTDLIREYNLDPDEFYDDYQIAGFDAKFQDYPVVSDCAFYVQYPEDKFHKLISRDAYKNYVERFDEDGMLMEFLLNGKGEVVFVYEPYTP